MTTSWHILTGEYPPALGGVSDYTLQVARGLAEAGDRVQVWCPAVSGPLHEVPGVQVNALDGGFCVRNLIRIGSTVETEPNGRRWLVQWVPHSFGMRSVNVPICLWVLHRSRKPGDMVDVMIHEARLGFRGSVRQRLAACVQHVMLAILLRAAARVWVSVPQWWDVIRPAAVGFRGSIGCMPVPSNVPIPAATDRVEALRAHTGNAPVVGHFGMHSDVTDAQLLPILETVLIRCPGTWLRLVGRGAVNARAAFAATRGDLADRIIAADGVALDEVACQLASCDVLVQPYLDGVSGRRTSLTAGLGLGVATVTHAAECTEPFWRSDQACRLADQTPEGYAEAVAGLIANPAARVELGRRALEVYDARFHIRHVIDRLRDLRNPAVRADDTMLLEWASHRRGQT